MTVTMRIPVRVQVMFTDASRRGQKEDQPHHLTTKVPGNGSVCDEKEAVVVTPVIGEKTACPQSAGVRGGVGWVGLELGGQNFG